MASVTLSKGRIVADAYEAEWLPRTATDSAVLFAPGFLSDATFWVGAPLPSQLAERGFACLAQDLGGPNTWGSNDYLTPCATCVTYMRARWSKLYFVGASMGGCSGLNYIRRNPTDFRASVLIAAAARLDALHDRDPTFEAAINLAYGDAAGYEAERRNRDPWEHTAEHTRDRMQFWVSTNDTVILPSESIDFAHNSGVRQPHSQGAVGHSLSGVDADLVAEFFRSY